MLDDQGSGGNDNARKITQDVDLEPSIFDDIAHQIEQLTEDSTDDQWFDQVIGLSWQD